MTLSLHDMLTGAFVVVIIALATVTVITMSLANVLIIKLLDLLLRLSLLLHEHNCHDYLSGYHPYHTHCHYYYDYFCYSFLF